MKREILDGQQFGEWTVLQYAGDRKQLCRCSCGNIQTVDTSSLKQGRSKHCTDRTKHKRNEGNDKSFKDLSNQQFGVLTVIEYVGESKWKCRCICGHEVILLSKNIRNHKHEKCTHVQKIQPVTRLENSTNNSNKKIEMINKTVGDLTIIKQVDSDRYLCRCICGLEKEIRGYSLRKASRENGAYICKHANIIGQQFGKLIVQSRLPNQICRCKCECGNTKDLWIGNLLNNSTISCGCLKSRKYNKQEVIEIIQQYINQTGNKPFSSDLSKLLGLGMTAVYEYIDEYGLKSYLNNTFGSKAEQDIYLYLKSICDNIECHNRKILKGLELDFYLPEKKLAIEYNGNYWHSTANNKDKKYHQHKTIECAKQGIRLIHIFEYEWINSDKQQKIKQLLKDIISNDKKVIYARNTNIVEPSVEETQEFLNKYHLQGYTPASIKIGLEYNKELVAVITFGKPRFNNNFDYEIIRLCYKGDVIITGGTERLLKYFIETYKPKNIITYSDISKFTGNTYTKLGFKVDSITEPNYVWVDNQDNVVTRYNSMKEKLIEKGLGTYEQTENEIMINNNFYKIYDCGHLKLVYITQ